MSAGLKPLTAGPDGPAPRHIAVIMDGNGRWAQSRGLPRAAGHRAGAHAVRRTIEAAVGAGLVLFLFTLVINTLAGVVVSRSRSGASTEI